MKHKSFLLSLIFACSFSLSVFSQVYDIELITSFMEAVRPISDKDEGILSLNEVRSEKIDLILKEKLPFFYLPSTVSVVVKCVQGDCVNGRGIVNYPMVGVRYEGFFRNGYPDSTGVVTIASGQQLNTFMKKGEMVGWQSFNIKEETFSPLEVYALHGRISEVKNMFWNEKNMIYTGKVNSRLKPNDKNGLARGSNFEAVVYLDYEGNLKEYAGKVNYGKFLYEGPLTTDMRFKSGGSFTHKEVGFKATPRIATDESGRVYYDLVTLEQGDSMYIGETNMNFLPHGRGLLRINNSEVNSGNWRNGMLVDSTGTYYAFQNKPDSLTIQEKMIEKLNFYAGLNKWNSCMYKGSPLNYFYLSAKKTMYTNPSIYIFNTSAEKLNICIRPQIDGYNQACFDIPPSFEISDTSELQLVKNAYAKIKVKLPTLHDLYTFHVSGAMPEEYYILVK